MSFGNFWSILHQFNHHSSQIDELLNDPDTTIEKLLEDDNIISEFKSLNPKLLEYCTDDRIKRLLSFIIEEPPANTDKNRGYKFPYVSCEILTAEVQTILSAFFGKNPNTIRKLNESKNPKKEEEPEDSGAINEEGEIQEKIVVQEDDEEKKEDEKAEESLKVEPTEAQTSEETKEKETEAEVEPPKSDESEPKKSASPEKTEVLTADVLTEKKEESPENNKEKSPEKGKSPEKDKSPEKSESPKKAEEDGDADKENKENEPVVESQDEKKSASPQASPQKEVEEMTTDKSEEVEFDPMGIANYFFSFLDQKELNVTLVGYFCRFLTHLVQKRITEISELIWTNTHIIDKMIVHLEHKALADCVSKLFILEGLPAGIENYIDARVKKMNELMNLFERQSEDLNPEALSNAALIVTEIINRRASMNGGNEFEAYFFSKDFLDIVFNNLFRHDCLTGSLTSILNALLQLSAISSPTLLSEKSDITCTEINDEVLTGENEDSLLYEYLAKKFEKIAEFLSIVPNKEVDTTYGKAIKPLGSTKVKLVETILISVKLNIPKMCVEIANSNIFKILMELVLVYEWNNILHNFVEKIITATLEGGSQILKNKLLDEKESNVLDFLVTSTRETTFEMPTTAKRQIRKGYLGHITKIAKVVEKLANGDNELRNLISSEKWAEFDSTFFRKTKDDEDQDLAGFARKASEDYYEDNIMIGHQPEKLERLHQFYNENSEEEDQDKPEDEELEEETNTIEYDAPNLSEDMGKHSYKLQVHLNSTRHQEEKNHEIMKGTHHKHEDHENEYMHLNRKVDVIPVGLSEEKLDDNYVNNHYWQIPIDKSINPDDLLAEANNIQCILS